MNKVRMFSVFLLAIITTNLSFAMQKEDMSLDDIQNKIENYKPQLTEGLLNQMNAYILEFESNQQAFKDIFKNIKEAYKNDSKQYNVFYEHVANIEKRNPTLQLKPIKDQIDQKFINSLNFVGTLLSDIIPNVFNQFLQWNIQDKKFQKTMSFGVKAIDPLQNLYSYIINYTINDIINRRKVSEVSIPTIINDDTSDNQNLLLSLRVEIYKSLISTSIEEQEIQNSIEKVKKDWMYDYLQQKLEALNAEIQTKKVVANKFFYPWHTTVTGFVLVKSIIDEIFKKTDKRMIINRRVMTLANLIWTTNNPDDLEDLFDTETRDIAQVLMEFEYYINRRKLPSSIKFYFETQEYPILTLLENFTRSDEDIIIDFFTKSKEFTKRNDIAKKIDSLSKLTKKNYCEIKQIIDTAKKNRQHIIKIPDILQDHLEKRCLGKKYYFKKAMMLLNKKTLLSVIVGLPLGTLAGLTVLAYPRLKLYAYSRLKYFFLDMQKLKSILQKFQKAKE